MKTSLLENICYLTSALSKLLRLLFKLETRLYNGNNRRMSRVKLCWSAVEYSLVDHYKRFNILSLKFSIKEEKT